MTEKKRTGHPIYNSNEYKTPTDQANVFLISHDKKNGSNLLSTSVKMYSHHVKAMFEMFVSFRYC